MIEVSKGLVEGKAFYTSMQTTLQACVEQASQIADQRESERKQARSGTSSRGGRGGGGSGGGSGSGSGGSWWGGVGGTYAHETYEVPSSHTCGGCSAAGSAGGTPLPPPSEAAAAAVCAGDCLPAAQARPYPGTAQPPPCSQCRDNRCRARRWWHEPMAQMSIGAGAVAPPSRSHATAAASDFRACRRTQPSSHAFCSQLPLCHFPNA